MLQRLLIGSIFITSTLISFSCSVRANEPTVDGSVPSECVFFDVTPGNLGTNTEKTILSSSDAEPFQGTPATVQIDCSGSATLSISKPDQNSGTTIFTDENLSASATSTTLNNLNINSENNTGGSNTIPVDSIGEIEINMTADNQGVAIAPGEYEFTVTITATPGG